ncbi:MAG TPA: AarF/ABC1/UbiB kinase family protein [Chthoniobacteraceae bacterium]|nr:AarF/ABC1/UbiB kinase family protein [Chthoniobacteraceae bacterium]
MKISLSPRHFARYKDVLLLLAKYGRSDLVKDAPVVDDPLDYGPPPPVPPAAKELAEDLEKLGPTFVKLGQLISTRADFIPPAYMEALARLQDHVEPFSFSEVEAIAAVEIGARLSKAFAEFESTPMAAASLGQVHRATLRDGRRVAVKVQRPNVREQVSEDLEAMQEIAELLDAHTEVGRRYRFSEIVEELRKSLLRELDYRQEAANLRLLGEKLRGFPGIVVPQPIDDYSTGRVLTMDYVAGRKVTELSSLARLDVDGEGLAEELFRAYLQQILVDGFFHADPHPGNVFLTDDGRIALLDLGMTARIEPTLQERLLKLLLAIAEGQSEKAADAAIQIGDARENFDEMQFRRCIAEVVGQQHGATVAKMQVGRVVMEVKRIAADCGIRIPPELTMLGKTLLNLDLVGRTLAPQFDPNQSIRKNAAQILHRRTMKALSPGNLFGALLETKELIEKLPARLNQLLELVATNKLKVEVDAIDEDLLMAGLQKVANRITLGLILAALIMGAALLMRIETTFRIFGYPGFAILFFLLASAGGIALAVQILRRDRR